MWEMKIMHEPTTKYNHIFKYTQIWLSKRVTLFSHSRPTVRWGSLGEKRSARAHTLKLTLTLTPKQPDGQTHRPAGYPLLPWWENKRTDRRAHMRIDLVAHINARNTGPNIVVSERNHFEVLGSHNERNVRLDPSFALAYSLAVPYTSSEHILK